MESCNREGSDLSGCCPDGMLNEKDESKEIKTGLQKFCRKMDHVD